MSETSNMTDTFPQATPHGEIQQIFDDVFFVTGSVVMLPGMQVSRNMIILREHGALTLISPLRLSSDGMAQLDQLGRVENIVQLGAYHLGAHNGLDDRFYVERYDAKLWMLEGMAHKAGLKADHILKPGGPMPVCGADLFVYESSSRPEAMVLLNRDGGILISADSLQNWVAVDPYFSEMAGERMTQAGFIRPANIGPEWRRVCQPDASEFAKVTALDFAHLLPSHGVPLLHDAKAQFEKTFADLL
jgi:hypothetical protein